MKGSVIVIVKRYDLPKENRQLAVEDLQLEHFELSAQVIEQAELSVVVEGSYIKYVKQPLETQSVNKLHIPA